MANRIISKKQQTMRLTGWTSAEYKRKYDVLANRVKNFRTLHPGANPPSTSQLLFYIEEAKAKGEPISRQRQQILETTAASPGALSKRGSRFSQSYREEYFRKEIDKHFTGLIANVTKAQAIMDDTTTTYEEKLRLLNDLADEIDKRKKGFREKARKGNLTEKDFEDYEESSLYDF